MSLARPFKAGEAKRCISVASDASKSGSIQSSLRDENCNNLIPALKRRAKLIPPLRVEDFGFLDSDCAEGGGN
jgi:hypothetical protein